MITAGHCFADCSERNVQHSCCFSLQVVLSVLSFRHVIPFLSFRSRPTNSSLPADSQEQNQGTAKSSASENASNGDLCDRTPRKSRRKIAHRNKRRVRRSRRARSIRSFPHSFRNSQQWTSDSTALIIDNRYSILLFTQLLCNNWHFSNPTVGNR
jgi:hypothetical protein